MPPRHLLVLAALCAAQPATAGVTAQYRLGQGGDQRMMTVEVNDRGEGRAVMGDGRIRMLIGGVDYVVEADAQGLMRAEVRTMPEPFVLPGPVLTRDAYVARRRAAQAD